MKHPAHAALSLALAASILMSGTFVFAEEPASSAPPVSETVQPASTAQPDAVIQQASPAASQPETSTQPVDPAAQPVTSTMAAPVEDWINHRDQAVALFSAGKLKEAEVEQKLAIEQATTAGASRDVLANMKLTLATIYRSQNNYDQAIVLYNEFVSEERKQENPNTELLSRVLNNTGEAYRAQKKYEQALTSLLQAKLLGNEQTRGYNELLLNLGMTYQAMKKYPEAETYLKQAAALSKTGVNANPQARYVCLKSLIMLYFQQGNLDKVEPVLKEAAPLADTVFGPGDTETKDIKAALQKVQMARNAKLWNQLMGNGNQKMQAKQFKLAATEYEKALKIVNVTEPKGQAAGLTRTSLGMAYLNLKDYARAENNLAQAVTILQKADPKNKNLASLQKGYQYAKAMHQAQKAAPKKQ